MMAGIVFGFAGFAIHSFFSYLRFRRLNAKGSGGDYETLENAYREYAHRTNARIERLEAIIADQDLPKEKDAKQLEEHHDQERQKSVNKPLSNRLERS
jgi:hypothetical protein